MRELWDISLCHKSQELNFLSGSTGQKVAIQESRQQPPYHFSRRRLRDAKAGLRPSQPAAHPPARPPALPPNLRWPHLSPPKMHSSSWERVILALHAGTETRRPGGAHSKRRSVCEIKPPTKSVAIHVLNRTQVRGRELLPAVHSTTVGTFRPRRDGYRRQRLDNKEHTHHEV
ncbi:hypothetical protein SKAU_G00081820 [Synaphobranchus kaupii]|uniref:Uncharacterized protein n=1 Tax=Synaphobranchus kaupii TaxID=118154 RepID=A0A9Q1FUN1_SYNKA|nr:hypothetical protein SKAU_G00081820 [Synaphobranchus kaupii]